MDVGWGDSAGRGVLMGVAIEGQLGDNLRVGMILSLFTLKGIYNRLPLIMSYLLEIDLAL